MISPAAVKRSRSTRSSLSAASNPPALAQVPARYSYITEFRKPSRSSQFLIAGFVADQFRHLAHGFLARAASHVMCCYTVLCPRRPTNLGALADAVLIGKCVAVLRHPRPRGSDVRAHELQNGGSLIPRH